LAAAIRQRLGSVPKLGERPLVSIVVVSRDGAAHLRVLLAGLLQRTDYHPLELIVVDNGSSDDSIAFLNAVDAPFPISTVANAHNASFSEANNQGAELASGQLLLFLNNDVELFEHGWLDELVACHRDSGAGASSATLLFPREDLARFPYGFGVHHRGIRFRDEQGAIAPALHEWEAPPLEGWLGHDVDSPAVVAACLLVEQELFVRVGGFSDGYFYGAEDIDLSLKIRAAGAAIVCSGRSVVIHRPGSTRSLSAARAESERRDRNRRTLLERWGPQLRREHDLDALACGGMWVQRGRESGAAASNRAEAEALGVCVRAGRPPSLRADDDLLERLRSEAVHRGSRCQVLRGEEVDDPRGLESDVAIYVGPGARVAPAPGQFNVLWVPEAGSSPTPVERRAYDLVLVDADPVAVLDTALRAAGAGHRPHLRAMACV
jgi:GT2 family glycosyltransferase